MKGGLGGIGRVRRFGRETPLLLVRETNEELLCQSLRFPHRLVSCLIWTANRMADLRPWEASLGVSG
jgi:hypothetical protein